MTRILAGIISLCLCAAAQAQSTLEVLDYGAEPRAPLRYHFVTGQSERAMMEMSINMASERDGKQVPMSNMPPTRTTMNLRVTEVLADGSARVEFETRSTEAPMGQAGGPANQAQLEKTLAGLSLLKGWSLTDTRGRVLDSGVSLPDGAMPAMTMQMMNEMMGDQSEAVQQFPEEAVGRGARWRVIQRRDMAGVKLATGQEYTLRSRSGNRVELDTRIIQPTADPATAPLPPGMPIQGVPTGTGTMVVDLNSLVPTIVMEVGSTTTIPAPAASQAPAMKMIMQMRMTTGPAKD
jgi:hypothetical protein